MQKQPIGFKAAIGDAFRIFGRHAGAMLLISVFSYAVITAPNIYLNYINGNFNEILKISIGLCSYLPLFLGTMAIMSMADSEINNSYKGVGSAFSASAKRLFRYTAAHMMSLGLFQAGLFFLIIPGFIIGIIFMFTEQASLLAGDKTGPLKYSLFLVKGYMKEIFILFLVIFLLPYIAVFFFMNGLADSLIFTFILVFLMPPLTVYGVVLYNRLVEIKKDDSEKEEVKKKLKIFPSIVTFLLAVLLWIAFFMISNGFQEAVKSNRQINSILMALKKPRAEFVDGLKIYNFDYPARFSVDRNVIPEIRYVLNDSRSLVMNRAVILRSSYGEIINSRKDINENTIRKITENILVIDSAAERGYNYYDRKGRESVRKDMGFNEYKAVDFVFNEKRGHLIMKRNVKDEKGEYIIEIHFITGKDGILALVFETSFPLNAEREELVEEYGSERNELLEMWEKGIK